MSGNKDGGGGMQWEEGKLSGKMGNQVAGWGQVGGGGIQWEKGESSVRWGGIKWDTGRRGSEVGGGRTT